MNKKTIIIVSLTLVLAIFAVAVISTFPTYLFMAPEDSTSTSSGIESGNITESTDDTINIGDSNGIDSVIPDIDDNPSDTNSPATSIKSYDSLAKNGGAELLAENGAFEKGSVFKVNKLGAFSKTYYRARHLVRDFASKYTIYNVTAQKDGKNVSPIADAKVVIDIPKSYALDKVEIYFLISDNQVTKLDCTIDKTERTAIVGFTQSGVYIIIEKKDVAASKPLGDTSSQGTESNVQSSSNNSSATSSDSSSSTIIDNDQTQSDNSSSTDSSNTSSSDETDEPEEPTTQNPEWETMDGWLPWY